MKSFYFVTGTDTNCGKTYTTLKLMAALQSQGKKVLGLKPIASGCIKTPDGLRNDDAVKLQQASSILLPYDAINPFAFEQPTAPYFAAAKTGTHFNIRDVLEKLKCTLETPCDAIFIEGAGGLMVPLNERECMIDLIQAINIPVIFVTLMQLGCINHTLLSMDALKSRGIQVHQWVPNVINPNMPYLTENINYLKSLGL